MASAAEIVSFWQAAGGKKWFAKDDAFDAELKTRFEANHHAAARREHDDWADTAEGALALVLLLDQVPRNLYRGTAHAFATDRLAQHFTELAIDRGFDRAVTAELRVFFYLPFEHAEDIGLQSRAVALTEALGIENYTRYAILHRDIIARFGRFPHRNPCLGRTSTAEELAFLEGGGFKG